MKPNFKPPKKSAIVAKALAPVPPTAEPEEEEKVDTSKIPLVTTALADDDTLAEICQDLLNEAEKLKIRYDEDAQRLKDIRTELGVYTEAYKIPGLRWGGIAFSYSGWRSNKRLDTGLLLENGVSPEAIANSYKETKPFIDSRFITPKRSAKTRSTNS